MQTYKRHVTSPLPLNYYLDTAADVGIEGLVIDDLNPFQSCEQGSFTHVSAFLLGGVDPNTSTMRGVSLLHCAAKAGQELIVRFLIDNGASVNAQDNDGLTPLMYACISGAGDTIKMLIEARADTSYRCRQGHSGYYYAAPHPIAFHFLTTAEPMPATLVAEEEILHAVCTKASARFAALYLIEQQGADPNLRSTTGTGGTPLHNAAMTGDLDLVKALVSKGADATITDGTGARPANMPKCPRVISNWLKRYLAEPSTTRRQQLALPDFTNWNTLFNLRELRSCLFYLTIPHWAIVVGTLIHPIMSLICFLCTLTVFGSVAQFSMKQKNRSIVTAAFYFGGMIIGMAQFYHKVAPVFDEDNPGSLCTPLATLFVGIAMYAYIRAVLADPGCAQSTAEQRKDFYTICHRAGERENFDQTAMVRKPLRSKHCTKTHQCVKRFDHYCVWTGNAVGSGNHRYFMLFCLCSVIGHAFLTREVIYYYIGGGAVSRQYPTGHTFTTFSSIMAFLATDANIVVSYFCIFYNAFVILFTGVMSLTQLSMISRNVTSNEEWFAQRYTWMFKLGSTTYNMFDEGKWNNLKQFWFGDLGTEVYTNPKMSEYLTRQIKAFSAKVKQEQGVIERESEMTPFNPTAAALANSPTGVPAAHAQNAPAQAPQSPFQNIAQQASVTIDQIPHNKQLEVTVTQMLFTQLIQGVADPQVPANVALAPERAQACVSQAHTMLAKYKERMSNLQKNNQQEASAPLAERKNN